MIKGLDNIKANMGNSATTFKIEDGKSAVIRFVTPASEIVSIYEHVEQFNGQWKSVTCLGKDRCPLCKAGKKAATRAYALVADRSDNDKVKIFKASKTVIKQLIGLVEEYGDITKRDFKISRTGAKLDTQYFFFARDPEPFKVSEDDLINIEEMIAPMSEKDIIALMGSNEEPAEYSTGSTDKPASGGGYPYF